MAQNRVIKVGSEKYGTAVMKTEECQMYFGVAVDNNGGDGAEAFADMKMVDALLHMSRLHLAIGKTVRLTSAGNLRKGSDLYSAYDSIIDGRVNGAFSV